MTLSSAEGRVTLDVLDFTSEPGEFSRFADFARFYERQGTIIKVISGSPLTVSYADQVQEITPRKTFITDLPFLFWIQIFVGLAALVLSGRVWSLKLHSMGRYFFFWSGISIMMASLSSAVYTTRELAIPEWPFRFLGICNAVGSVAFGISLTWMFLVYPMKIRYWKQLGLAQTVFFTLWLSCFLFQWTWVNLNFCFVIQMLFLCGAIGVQVLLTEVKTKERATLTWLGISAIFGGGAFLVFNSIPVILEITPLNQGYSFLFILVVFFGLAAGLTEFRLYSVGRWAFQLVSVVSALVIFSLIVYGFIHVLKMDRFPAAGLALVLIAIMYFPMRESMRKFFRKKHAEDAQN
jgi:hypothetical protein